jgi:hypothetical protein
MKPFLFVLFLLGCGTSTVPNDAGGNDANTSDAPADVANEAAPTCKHAGDACTPSDNCNVWSCKCANISSPEITVGACKGGTCQSGTDACTALCSSAGGVTTAMDTGC